MQTTSRAAEELGVDRPTSRRPGGAVHRGMVYLLRHQTRWLVELLIARRFLPVAGCAIEFLPTENWPVGEENRIRENRANLVVQVWAGSSRRSKLE